MSKIHQRFWVLDGRTVIRASMIVINASALYPGILGGWFSYRLLEAKSFMRAGVDYAGPLLFTVAVAQKKPSYASLHALLQTLCMKFA